LKFGDHVPVPQFVQLTVAVLCVPLTRRPAGQEIVLVHAVREVLPVLTHVRLSELSFVFVHAEHARVLPKLTVAVPARPVPAAQGSATEDTRSISGTATCIFWVRILVPVPPKIVTQSVVLAVVGDTSILTLL
jgi:hypothetical protein